MSTAEEIVAALQKKWEAEARKISTSNMVLFFVLLDVLKLVLMRIEDFEEQVLNEQSRR